MAATDLLTYTEALSRLGESPETWPPSRIAPLISAITQYLERATGSYFVARQYVETLTIDSHGWKDLLLHKHPITSVVSIIDNEGNTIASTDYTVIGRQGRLRHKGTWPMSDGLWSVTVVGGWFATTADVGEDLKRAACILLQDGMASSGSGTVISEKVGPVSVTYADTSQTQTTGIPPEVGQLIAPYRNVRVF